MEASDVACVRKWGGLTADAILDPACRIFRFPEAEGLIGYWVENGCAIVFGDPVCPQTQIENLIPAFHEYCAKERLKIIYLIVSEEFAQWLIQSGYCKCLVEFGEELFLDPHEDPRKKEGVQARLVRRKERHALREGVKIKEYIPHDDRIEKEIIQVSEKWLRGRKGPQIYFSNVRPFDCREGKRWFYAEKKGQFVGILILSSLEREQGWLLNHLMFVPEAPTGVPELLVVSALETLSREDCKYVTFGTVPAGELGEILGLGAFPKYLARAAYKLVNLIYHLNGKKIFWQKFDPASKKTFVAFKESRIGLKEIIALKKVLNA